MRRDPPAGRPRFLATKAKRDVLRLLADYFCARTNDIADLNYGRARESQRRSTRRTLLLLFREGFVARLPHFDFGRAAGGFTYVYGLSKQGVRFADERGFAAGATKPFGAGSARILDHELLITVFHRAVAAHAKARRLDLYWLQRRLKRTIHPDAVFALTDPGLPEGRNTRYWFLEIERAKSGGYIDGEAHLARKLRAYVRYHGSAACAREWVDFRDFKVLIIVSTERRARAVAAVCRSLTEANVFQIAPEAACTSEGIGQHL